MKVSSGNLMECQRCGAKFGLHETHACTPYAHRVKKVQAERDAAVERADLASAYAESCKRSLAEAEQRGAELADVVFKSRDEQEAMKIECARLERRVLELAQQLEVEGAQATNERAFMDWVERRWKATVEAVAALRIAEGALRSLPPLDAVVPSQATIDAAKKLLHDLKLEDEILTVGACPCGQPVSEHQVTRTHATMWTRFRDLEREIGHAHAGLDALGVPRLQKLSTLDGEGCVALDLEGRIARVVPAVVDRFEETVHSCADAFRVGHSG